jgi:hypothetical protein
MKKVLLAMALLVSANVFALGADSSWQEINASYATDVRAPQIFFASGEATTAYSIFETCVNGEMMQTIGPKDVYVQVRHGKNDVELVVVGQKVLSTPRTYTKTIYTGGHGNQHPVDVVITTPLFNNIDVFEKVDHRRDANFMFTKSYTIPACK